MVSLHGVAPIQLDAVYDTTCRKCGGKGLLMYYLSVVKLEIRSVPLPHYK